MRIVHDVDAPMAASVGIDQHGRCNLFACTDVPGNHPDLPKETFMDEDEVIEIEGDVKYIRKMLEEWLTCITDIERIHQERGK